MRPISHRLRVLLTTGTMLLAGGAPLAAHADWKTDVGNIFANLIMLLLQAVSWLVAQVTHYLIIIAQYSDFTRNQVVNTGWDIVVSIANMFFIVALLVIAIGTVLRIQNYRYTRLLGNVIVMAFFVNFSKSIAAFFIQTSQIIMLTFVSAFKDAAFGNFATMFGLDKVLSFSQTVEPKGQLDVFAGLFIGLLFMTIACVTIIALSIVLTVRIVYLWLLVIMSPFAYAMRVLPNTERYAKQWWDLFGKWVTTGPVIAFFLWLALAILSQSTTGTTTTTRTAGSFIADNPSISKAIEATPSQELDVYFGNTRLLEVDQFISFIVAIVFLWIGLGMATGAGGVAGKWAGKVAAGGFAAYGVVSGLNAIRDRTVAPIQGYLKQREQRRGQAITERTAGLSARVDQATSATVGQVGRFGAGAVAGTKAVLTGQGLTKSADAARAGFAVGTRGQQQREQRIEGYVAGQVATEAKDLDFTKLSPETLASLARTSSGARQMNAVQTMLAQGLMDEKYISKTDQTAAMKKMLQFAGKGKLGREVITNAQKQDAAATRDALFGDFSDQSNRDVYYDLARQRIIGSEILSQKDKEFLSTTPGVAKQFANFAESIAKNKTEMDNVKKGLGEYADDILKEVDMTGKSFDARKMMAESWGQIQTAFREAGVLQEADLIKFAGLHGGKYSDFIAATAAQDSEMIAALVDNKKLSESEMMKWVEKGDDYRSALKAGLGDETAAGPTGALATIYARSAATGGKSYNLTNDKYAQQNTIRRAILKTSRGENSPFARDIEAGVAGAEESLQHVMKTAKATDLSKGRDNPLFAGAVYGPKFRMSLARRMSPKELGELYGMGGKSALMVKQALTEYQAYVATLGLATPAAMKANPDGRRLNKLLTNESTADIF